MEPSLVIQVLVMGVLLVSGKILNSEALMMQLTDMMNN